MKNDDIEKLFSSLEDFSKTPPDDLWKGIEEKLDNSKVKRLPIWWWSVAASLVVGLGLLASFYFNSSENLLINTPVENGVVNQLKVEDSVEKDEINNKIESEKKVIDSRLSDSNKAEEKQQQNSNTTTKVNPNAFNSNNIKINNSKKETVAVITNNTTSVLGNKKDENTIAEVIKKEEKGHFVQQKQINESQKAIVENSKVDPKIKEDLPATDLKENALATIEKELNKKEKKIALIEDKWSMQVFAGVNNSQNLKKQKSLGNDIESQNGYNYGVKANYKLNSRWAVSTGLKVSELGQQVANVSYINSSKNLVNISKAPFAASSQEKNSISNNPNYLFVANSNSNTNMDKNAAMATNTFYETGDLSQRVQYLEIPMEVSYALLNKGKARINMNTGGFIGKAISNEVLLDNNNIGENQDVNDVVFGTLLSSTLQYELFKKTKVFVEPGMNFYTQPVQNQNFNQFQLIFNFGLNVSF